MDDALNVAAAREPVGDTLDSSAEDRKIAAKVEDFVTALLKDYRARQAYVAGNPLIERFHHAVRDQALGLWDVLPHLTIRVDEGRFLWRDHEVYDHPLGHDNVAFLFFKDGLRTMAFLPGCEVGELREFLDIIVSVRQGRAADLLATLWHRDFSLIRFEYVDITEDESLVLPEIDRFAGAGETIQTDEITRVVEAGPVASEVDDGFAAILLTEADRNYLRRELELELTRPLARDVTLALLDQFEMRDQERRRQVVDILRELLPRLLSAPDFGTVALIVNELQLLANKTGERDTQELVASLLRDMSEAMAELVSASSVAGEQQPAEDELKALLGALQADAIPTLVRALPAIADAELRAKVAEALDRLVDQSPEHVTRLLVAEDPMLAAEAAEMVARLRIEGVTPALVRAAGRAEVAARRAAVAALGVLGGGRAAETVKEAMRDEEMLVRIAAVEALAELRPDDAEQTILAVIQHRDFTGRDHVEQMAVLKALVGICGECAVAPLNQILNGRRWFGVRRPAPLRASAARSLALVGSPAAAAALARARRDRSPSVAQAVRLSLQHVEDGPGPEPERKPA